MPPDISTPSILTQPYEGFAWASQAEKSELDRIGGMIDHLSPQQQKVVMDEVKKRLIKKRPKPIWKKGIEPLPFDAFCDKCLGLQLYPLQRAIFEESGLLYPSQIINPQREKQVLVIVYGKGAGKDIVIAAFIAYLGFLVNNLVNPEAIYGVHEDTNLSVINVAPSEEVAADVFFDYLRKNIEKKVFKSYIKNKRRQILDDEIKFPQCNLSLYSKHSNPRTLEGFSPIAYVIDEGDDFPDTKNRRVAKMVFDRLRTSSTSRYGTLSIGILISYPRTENGFMMEEYAYAEKDPTYYRKLATTFDVNPKRSMDEPNIKSEFFRDPTGARAKYLCQPVPVAEAFFEYPERIAAAVDPQLKPCANIIHDKPRKVTVSTGEEFEYVTLHLEDIVRRPGAVYFMGGDAGEKKDAFTMAVTHIETEATAPQFLCPDHGAMQLFQQAATYLPWEGDPRPVGDAQPMRCGICSREARHWGDYVYGWWKRAELREYQERILVGGREWVIPHVYEDLLIEFRPEVARLPGEKNRSVDFIAATKAAEDLIKNLGIIQARFDPYSTIQMRQELISSTGCDVDEISFGNKDQLARAKLVKMVLYMARLSLLPVTGVRNTEWRQLQYKGAIGVDHPENGSKDCFDAESIAIWLAVLYACNGIDAWFLQSP